MSYLPNEPPMKERTLFVHPEGGKKPDTKKPSAEEIPGNSL